MSCTAVDPTTSWLSPWMSMSRIVLLKRNVSFSLEKSEVSHMYTCSEQYVQREGRDYLHKQVLINAEKDVIIFVADDHN
jgi:hypothetical protein